MLNKYYDDVHAAAAAAASKPMVLWPVIGHRIPPEPRD
jgi:hypothetical protein